MAHSIGSCLMDSTICCTNRPPVSPSPGKSKTARLFVSLLLTGNLRGPYLASCRAEADLKGVGVQGDDSMMERRMFGVLNLSKEKGRLVNLHSAETLHSDIYQGQVRSHFTLFLRSEGKAAQGLGLHRRGQG